VDKLLRADELSVAISRFGRETVKEAARDTLMRLRQELVSGSDALEEELQTPQFHNKLCLDVASLAESRSAQSLVPVFNLTGTVIHTNLGRASLPESAIDAVGTVSRQAINLEYDLAAGSRGDRESHVEEILCQLTGAEAATVVNNNAAAVVLVLTTLAVGRDVLISRGELVEIGGAFRIPEVMGSAGCHLKEIGATNRTHLADYERAIDDDTALLMKVHTSNYEIMGFFKSVAEPEIAALAHQYGLPFVVDLGSGTLIDLTRFGLPREPTVSDSLSQGADLVTFSGDKLLGGPQAGIVAGKRDLIARLKKNPLKRALRVDKLTLAALGSVLHLYRNPSELARTLPILRDLSRSTDEIAAIAEKILPCVVRYVADRADVEIAGCKSQIGSGALPVDLLESVALKITPRASKGADKQLNELALEFRKLPVPVVGRLHDGSLYFDLRCLHEPDRFCQQLSG
jgi:L-seryl-tRNA(Ser) seleniumtransferase